MIGPIVVPRRPTGFPVIRRMDELSAQGIFHFCSEWWVVCTNQHGYWYFRRDTPHDLIWRAFYRGNTALGLQGQLPKDAPIAVVFDLKRQIVKALRYHQPTPSFNEQYIRHYAAKKPLARQDQEHQCADAFDI